MAIDFSIDSEELKQALKPFFAGRARGKEAALEYVDVKAQKGEIEFVSTAIAATIPGEVVSSGCARIPFQLFETLFRKPQKLADGHLSIQIREGQIQAGPMTVNNRDVSVLLIGSRIADLPLDAPLLETLALTLRFSDEELADSALSARVEAAQRRTDDIIDRVTKLLQPLGITRAELDRFVTEQIKRRAGK
jgi:hypothetical protein